MIGAETGSGLAPRESEHTLRWVLAHEPPVVFEDASRVFVDRVHEGTNGDVRVQLYSNDEYSDLRGGPTLSRKQLVECLLRGDIEMAHNYVSALGHFHAPFWAVEMPFLFRDYEHAERALEGPLATRILEGMVEEGLRGLCFAYSGGFRIVASKGRRFETLEDFAGARIRTAGNPAPEALWATVGADATAGELGAIAGMARADRIDAAEITYVRYEAAGLPEVLPVVNDTGHSLFTTAMAVNEAWFRKLTDAQQAVVWDAAREAGRIERERAIEEERRTRLQLPDDGVEIVTLRADASAALQERAQLVYEQLAPRMGADLLAGLRTA